MYEKRPSSCWNGLDEFSADDPNARDILNCLAEASVIKEKNPGGNSSQFLDVSRILFRGCAGHVKTHPAYEDKRHLGTVYDLITKGHTGEEEHFCPKAFERLLLEMASNGAINGVARDAAAILLKVGARERGSYISTTSRAIDWINTPNVRAVIERSDFSLREIKRDEMSLFVMIPEAFIGAQQRLLRTLYGMAFMLLDEHNTPQPEDSDRETLILVDEINKFGRLESLGDALVVKRSSKLKCVIAGQNLDQINANFANPANVLTSCDKQFFGLDRMDKESFELIREALGTYSDAYFEGDNAGRGRYSELKRDLMSGADLAEWLDPSSKGQIVLPLHGRPMKLKRCPYYKLHPKSAYGKVDY